MELCGNRVVIGLIVVYVILDECYIYIFYTQRKACEPEVDTGVSYELWLSYKGLILDIFVDCQAKGTGFV